MTTRTDVTPKVWIGCLASYNAGRLIGEWAEADGGLEHLEAIQEDVKQQAIAAAKEAGEWPVYFTEPEEFFLADHEGFPEGMVGEYTSLERVAEIAEALAEVYDRKALEAYMSMGVEGEGADIADIVSNFEEAFSGEFDSMTDFAEDYVDQGCMGEIPEHLDSYIDYEKLARDLAMDYVEVDGYVFNRNI